MYFKNILKKFTVILLFPFVFVGFSDRYYNRIHKQNRKQDKSFYDDFQIYL